MRLTPGLQPHDKDPLGWLKPLLVLVLVLLAGPELYASVEIIAVLDILGVTLFLLSQGYGIRLAAIQTGSWLYRNLVPIHLRVWPRPCGVAPGLVLVAYAMHVVLYYCVIGATLGLLVGGADEWMHHLS